MSDQAEALKLRTKRFALRIIKVCRSLPRSAEAKVIGNQLLRSGTSIGANYWAACRARSRAEFAAKIGIVVEETQETVFWLELLVEAGLFRRQRLQNLLTEANELLAIFAASQITARSPR
ncbi:MAG: four helix bundle protein [Terriglobales bacterium]